MMNAHTRITATTAPTNLGEALDVLQRFLPTDRSVSITSYRGESSLAGMMFVHVTTGAYGSEIKGGSSAGCRTLSGALFAAEADHAEKWTARYGGAAIAAAEFGRHFAAEYGDEVTA